MMLWLLLVVLFAAAWAYHCWAVLRAWKGGYEEGAADQLYRVSSW